MQCRWIDRHATLPRCLGLAALAWCALLPSPAARAETTGCIVIASLPAMLDAPGHYCLEADSSQDFVDAAIWILADNVVLDCNGHRIRNTYALNDAIGVTTGNRNQVVIRNCVLDGFRTGINVFADSVGRGDGNSIVGNHVLNSRKLGILLSGSRSVVADNRITRVSGNAGGPVYGILLDNYGNGAIGNELRNNVIADFKPSPQAGQGGVTYAIQIYGARNTVIEGNTISGLYASSDGWVWAIQANNSQQIVTGNTVLAPGPLPAPLDGAQAGGIYLSGLRPEDDLDNPCTDNVVGGFTTNISGCVKSGNTEF
jgi:parallel beta-helix repeat protein